MANCEHVIGWDYDCGVLSLIDEEDLIEWFVDEVEYNAENTSALDWTLDYLEKELEYKYKYELFDYCPDCGRKLDHDAIRKRVDTAIKQTVIKLYEAGKLKKPKKTKKQKELERWNEVGYVYLVKMGEHYKIGISKSPEKRLGEFTKLPNELEKICVVKVKGYKRIEEYLHEHFADKRVRGEWFELNEEDIEYIKEYLKEYDVE